MSFEEALELAHMIRQRETWILLEIEVKTGSRLDDDAWQVLAFSTLHWGYMHYFARPHDHAEFTRYAESWEAGTKVRMSTHEQ